VRLDTSDGEVFINVFHLTNRLVIIGAVHIAQALVSLARAIGYDVVFADPRSAFATEERFTGMEIARAWPDEALPRIGLDARAAVVVLSHDPKIDDPALIDALGSDAFYVGALGSKQTHASAESGCRKPGSPTPISSAFTRPSDWTPGRKDRRRSRSPSSPRSWPLNAARRMVADECRS
jgi:xanthine dehydrogenase accessory factor